MELGLPDGVTCSNGKDCWYIVGYQVDGETIILVSIKTPKTVCSYSLFQYDHNSAYEVQEWVLCY